jgi:hypothetical protein
MSFDGLPRDLPWTIVHEAPVANKKVTEAKFQLADV